MIDEFVPTQDTSGNSANPSESEFFTLQNRSESLDFDDLDNVSQILREFVNKTNGWMRFLSMGSLHTITGHSWKLIQTICKWSDGPIFCCWKSWTLWMLVDRIQGWLRRPECPVGPVLVKKFYTHLVFNYSRSSHLDWVAPGGSDLVFAGFLSAVRINLRQVWDQTSARMIAKSQSDARATCKNKETPNLKQTILNHLVQLNLSQFCSLELLE